MPRGTGPPWHFSGAVVRPPWTPLSCRLSLFLPIFAPFCDVCSIWSLLPAKENKTSKSSKNYVIIRAKSGWKRHIKYDKMARWFGPPWTPLSCRLSLFLPVFASFATFARFEVYYLQKQIKQVKGLKIMSIYELKWVKEAHKIRQFIT